MRRRKSSSRRLRGGDPGALEFILSRADSGIAEQLLAVALMKHVGAMAIVHGVHPAIVEVPLMIQHSSVSLQTLVIEHIEPVFLAM